MRDLVKRALRDLTLRDLWELPGRPRRRALLSYLVHPLIPPRCLRNRVMFSNRGLAQEWVRALNRLGFSVDVVAFDNPVWRPRRPYSLFVGHGAINFARLADALPRSTPKVYFGTGLHQEVHNARAAARAAELERRRGIDLPADRWNGADECAAYDRADAIVCLGDRSVADSYGRRDVFPLQSAVYPVPLRPPAGKDFEAARSEFLFFAGPGNLHKGLDLLLEAFAGLPMRLHVCQHLQPGFASAFRQELSQPNIQVHGFLPMRSPAFLRLVKRCGWIILPTCAEGQPGSVLEGMAHGLVPIVPDAANVPLDAGGNRIDELSVAGTRRAVIAASRTRVEDLARMSEATARKVAVDFSVGKFRRTLVQILRRILAERGGQSPGTSGSRSDGPTPAVAGELG